MGDSFLCKYNKLITDLPLEKSVFALIHPIRITFLMSHLPSFKVNHTASFFNTGCDFAGPFLLKDGNTR